MPKPSARRRPAALLCTIGAMSCLAFVGPAIVHADSIAPVSPTTPTGSTGATGATGPATDIANNYTCTGHISLGTPEDGVSGTQVLYQFSCDGPITGYQIETEPHSIQYFDQAPSVALAGVPQIADNFACNAFVPGVAINCVGSTSAADEVISGQFATSGKLCAEPRIDPILTVTEATATVSGTPAKATITQSMAGPYDLGRPRGCPADAYSGDTRLGSTPPAVLLTKHGKGSHSTKRTTKHAKHTA